MQFKKGEKFKSFKEIMAYVGDGNAYIHSRHTDVFVPIVKVGGIEHFRDFYDLYSYAIEVKDIETVELYDCVPEDVTIHHLERDYMNCAPGIEVKENETIELFEYLDDCFNVCFLNSEVKYPHRESGTMYTAPHSNAYTRLLNGRSFKIYADDFTVVDSE